MREPHVVLPALSQMMVGLRLGLGQVYQYEHVSPLAQQIQIYVSSALCLFSHSHTRISQPC